MEIDRARTALQVNRRLRGHRVAELVLLGGGHGLGSARRQVSGDGLRTMLVGRATVIVVTVLVAASPSALATVAVKV